MSCSFDLVDRIKVVVREGDWRRMTLAISAATGKSGGLLTFHKVSLDKRDLLLQPCGSGMPFGTADLIRIVVDSNHVASAKARDLACWTTNTA